MRPLPDPARAVTQAAPALPGAMPAAAGAGIPPAPTPAVAARWIRYVTVELTLAFGLGLTLAAFTMVRDGARRQLEATFGLLASDRAAALHGVIGTHVEILQSVAGFYAGSQFVDRQEFRAFVRGALLRHPDIQALAWVPRVPDSLRASCEAAARADGHPSFHFTEQDLQLRLVPAGQRAEYYPIHYLEPADDDFWPLGLDAATQPAGRDAIDRARKSGALAATTPVPVRTETGEEQAVALFLPIYPQGPAHGSVRERRRVLTGFAVAVMRTDLMIAGSISSLGAGGVDLDLDDTSAGEPARHLESRRSGTRREGADLGTTSEASTAGRFLWSRTFDVGGRDWTLSLRPTSAFFAEHRSWNAWLVLAGGLAFTALLVIYLTSVVGRATRISRLVAERTAELRSANTSLQREIDQRQRAEEEMRQQKEFSVRLVDSSMDGIVAFDRGHHYTVWNAGMERISGLPKSEALGKSPSTIFPSLVDGAMAHAHAAVLAGESIITEPLPFLIPQTGRSGFFEGHFSPLQDDRGVIFGGIGIVRDVTERKRVAEALQNAKEAAEAANRAKSEFLANMSHEIRTPMNGIIGMTDLALETQLTPEQRDYLSMAKASAEALLGVINDILDFSKVEAGKLDLYLTDFDLRDSIGDTMKSLSLRAHEKSLELAYDVRPDVPEVLVGDCGRLRQVLINLVGNAIKFTERGEVVVHVAVESRDDDGVALHFAVADTGIGIPSEKLALVFAPFEQADGSTARRFGGTGLGLAISRRLVELMGGRCWVESQVGAGSTFHFTIYFGLQNGAAHQPEPVAVDLTAMRVLIVDDNATNRRILEEIVRGWRMQPTCVDGGRPALAAMLDAVAAGQSFPLVLLDAMMPEMDGFELAARIQEQPALSGATIMMLSSADRSGDVARCVRLGISTYLTKPVRPSDLLDAVVGALGQRREAPRAASAAAGVAADAQVAALSAAPRRLRILLAEDNPVNQKLAVYMLTKRGHSVFVAANGRLALEALDARPIDLVLMDVQMPEMGGFEATAAIRANERPRGTHLPIIAMTAHAMKGDRERCLAAGMDAYLSKPLRASDLFAAIDNVASLLPPAPAQPAHEDDDAMSPAGIEPDRSSPNPTGV